MMTISVFITSKCNSNCEYCIAGCGINAGRTDTDVVLDIDAVLRWVEKHFDGPVALHLTGGEPLLVEDIYDIVKKCVDAGHDVTLFTNGSLIHKNTDIIDLDIKWHVTHHRRLITIDDFLENIEIIKHKPHVIGRLVIGGNALNEPDDVANYYKGFDFHWIVLNGGYKGYDKKTEDANPCEKILLIGLNGEIFPCSTPRGGELGNVYDLTFDKEKAASFCCLKNETLHKCQAYQSSEIMGSL